MGNKQNIRDRHNNAEAMGKRVQSDKYKTTGDLSKEPLNGKWKKVCPKKLTEYLREPPDTYQSEIAEIFGCSQSAVSQAMKKHKITRKKRQLATESPSKSGGIPKKNI
jgi:transposase